MSRIKVFSDNKTLIEFCLKGMPSLEVIDNIRSGIVADVVVIDAEKIDRDEKILSLFSNKSIRFLIIGLKWPEEKQVKALLHGAAGYCDTTVPSRILNQAVESILKGDIWIQRHLVPQIIGSLMQAQARETERAQKELSEEDKEILKLLSKREMDVVKMINIGSDNKSIASALFISERTVKSHLTSIFRKLKVPNRLHLAVLIKEIG